MEGEHDEGDVPPSRRVVLNDRRSIGAIKQDTGTPRTLPNTQTHPAGSRINKSYSSMDTTKPSQRASRTPRSIPYPTPATSPPQGKQTNEGRASQKEDNFVVLVERNKKPIYTSRISSSPSKASPHAARVQTASHSDKLVSSESTSSSPVSLLVKIEEQEQEGEHIRIVQHLNRNRTPGSLHFHVEENLPKSPPVVSASLPHAGSRSAPTMPLVHMPEESVVSRWLEANCRTLVSAPALRKIADIFTLHGVNSEEELQMLAVISESAQDEWLKEASKSGLTTLWRVMIKEALRSQRHKEREGQDREERPRRSAAG